MKNLYIISAAAIVMMTAGCGQEVLPLEFSTPEVSFPIEEETIRTSVGEQVEFTAEIVSGDRLVCSWYVDEVQEASTASFTYVFHEPGTYSVRFEARNGAGVVGRTYTVIVSDILRMTTSVGDSTEIRRYQNTYLKVMAIVEEGSGSELTHSWSVDGEQMSDKAYFDTFLLSRAKTYKVSYFGENAAGTYSKDFDVIVLDAPLDIAFSKPQGSLSAGIGEELTIEAEVRAGETGIRHEWKIDGEQVSSEAVFSHVFGEEGTYAVTYTGINAKGESIEAEWTVTVSIGVLFDDFENVSSLASWWENGNPSGVGITLEDNPDPSGINQSSKVMRDYVAGQSSTSGVFTLKLSVLDEYLKGRGYENGVSAFTGLRFKIYFGTNEYYPRIEYDGGKRFYPDVLPAHEEQNVWTELVFYFDAALDASKSITIKPLIDENDSNITNFGDRTVYMDNFELLE